MMTQNFSPIPLAQVKLLPSLFQHRFDLNRNYLVSLRTDRLLQNFYLEAGLTAYIFRATSHGAPDSGDDWHWGWESPTCQLRGHFLGHWLSAAAKVYAATGDPELKGKADRIVSELGRCQQENGGEWVGSIPEKYLDWITEGKRVWAPHYTLHKTLMGLYDMYTFADNEQALDILDKFAQWFHRWTGQFSQEQMDDILDVETGGMLEAWADLYGVTKKQEHLDLIERYERRRLFNRLLAGEDPLTNRHANTTIPEAHGAARAYEVTGDQRWRDITEAYWRCAVTDRGYFCTGSQTSGEIWTPSFEFAARLGDKNQEHCVVYNMIRLADFLFRWTGDVAYADYIERNIYNGILAQQHSDTGMIAYFLPLEPGAQKIWGSPTNDFWCCHGSLVQAHTIHNAHVYYEDEEGLAVCQYIPTELTWEKDGVPVTVRQTADTEACPPAAAAPDGAVHRPQREVVELSVSASQPVTFDLKLRLPWWLSEQANILVNGEPQTVADGPASFTTLHRTWQNDTLRLELPKALSTCPLPDQPDTVAFMDGPVVLAGLVEDNQTLSGDKNHPDTILSPENEREWIFWRHGYRTVNQSPNIRFVPLHQVRDERYTIYFPVQEK
jgi:hypothetical protein